MKTFFRKLIPERVLDFFRQKLKLNQFKPYMVSKSIDGVDFDMWIADPTGEAWYLDCNKPTEELIFLKGMVDSDEVILEAGPHHGFTTILLAKWLKGGGKITALEALPHNADVLRKNMDQNKLKNVIVENKAVGAEKGKIMIRGGSNSSVVKSKWDAAHEVEMTTLDNYTDLKPTFLKIDVEGFEVEVLKGATEILKTKPKLAIEVHLQELADLNKTPKDVLDFIDDELYDIWLQADGASAPELYDKSEIAFARQVHVFAIPKK